MKPQSSKNKGRKLQQWVATHIKQFFNLHDDDVRSTSMGAGGEDIQLSPHARSLFPYQVECKSRAKFAIYQVYEQCQRHGENEPLLIIKQDNKKPLAVVDALHFMTLCMEKANYDKIIHFPKHTRADHNPDQILDAAQGLTDPVCIVGFTDEGEIYVASNTSDAAENVYILEKAKNFILNQA